MENQVPFVLFENITIFVILHWKVTDMKTGMQFYSLFHLQSPDNVFFGFIVIREKTTWSHILQNKPWVSFYQLCQDELCNSV